MKVSIDADPLTLLRISAAKDKSGKTWTQVVCDGLGVENNQPVYGRPSAGDAQERYSAFLKEYQADIAEQVRQDMVEKTREMQRENAKG